MVNFFNAGVPEEDDLLSLGPPAIPPPIPQAPFDAGSLRPREIGPLGRFRRNFVDNLGTLGPALAQILTTKDASGITDALNTILRTRQTEIEREFNAKEREKEREDVKEAQQKDIDAATARLTQSIAGQAATVTAGIEADKDLQKAGHKFNAEELNRRIKADRDIQKDVQIFQATQAGATLEQAERLFFQSEANRFKGTLLPLMGTLNPATGQPLIDAQNISSISEAMAKNDFSELDDTTISLLSATQAIENLRGNANSQMDLFKMQLDFLSSDISRVLSDPKTGLPEIDRATGKPKVMPLGEADKIRLFNLAAGSAGFPPIVTEEFLNSLGPTTDKFGNTEDKLLEVQEILTAKEAASNSLVKGDFIAAETDQQTLAAVARLAEGGGLNAAGLIEFVTNADYLTTQQVRVIRDFISKLQQTEGPRSPFGVNTPGFTPPPNLTVPFG